MYGQSVSSSVSQWVVFVLECSNLFKNLNLLKVTDIVKLSNIIFTHNAINNKTPTIFKDFFTFKDLNHQHQTVNGLNSIYSIPAGSILLPTFRTNSGKSSIRYICSSTWNLTLKELSMKNIEKYNKDPFWLSRMNVQTFNNILKKHFLEYYWQIQDLKTIRITSKNFFSFSLQLLFDYNLMESKH